MSDKPLFNSTQYHGADNLGRRLVALSAAIELIAARVTSAPANGTHLDQEMKKLTQYVDAIQEAAKLPEQP